MWLWNLALLFIMVCGYSNLDVAIFGQDVFPMHWAWFLLMLLAAEREKWERG